MMTRRLLNSLRRYSRCVLSVVTINQRNNVFDSLEVYQPAGKEENAAIGYRQSDESTVEENAKEVLLLVNQYYDRN